MSKYAIKRLKYYHTGVQEHIEMPRFLSAFVLAAALLVTAGCAITPAPVSDIKVNAEVSPDYTAAEYKTYAWLASAEIINDPDGNWEPRNFDADAHIKSLIEKEMRDRDIAQVAAFPNIFVAFVAGVDMARLELREDPGQKIDVLQNVPKGAVVVMIIDGATGNPVWAAAAVGEVDTNRTPEEVKARLDYVVHQMFRKLPGRAKNEADFYDY